MKLEYTAIKSGASPVSINNWNSDASAKWRSKEHYIEIYNLTNDLLPVMMFRTQEKKWQITDILLDQLRVSKQQIYRKKKKGGR